MNRDFSFYSLIFLGFIFVLVELFNIKRKLSNLKKVRETKATSLESLKSAGVGQSFEFNAVPISTNMDSPISHKSSLYWTFDVIQLSAGHSNEGKGALQSVPVVVMEASFKWLLFESDSFTLALPANKDGPDALETFVWTSAISVHPPLQLERFLNSSEFKEHLKANQIPWHNLYPNFATTFREMIVPPGRAFHAHGIVRNLKPEEIIEIERRLDQLGVRKSLLPLTLHGEDFRISNFSEDEMIRTLNKELIMHTYLLIFGLVLIFIFVN